MHTWWHVIKQLTVFYNKLGQRAERHNLLKRTPNHEHITMSEPGGKQSPSLIDSSNRKSEIKLRRFLL
jgi:hypothetical protein